MKGCWQLASGNWLAFKNLLPFAVTERSRSIANETKAI